MPGKQLPHNELIPKNLPRKGEGQTDQVKEDLSKLSSFINALLGRVKEDVSSKVSVKKPDIKKISSPLKNIFDPYFIKKIVRIIVIAAILIALFYIGSIVIRTVLKDGQLGGGAIPTPSVAPYQPYKPSIYADDERLLQMEEEEKILDREMSAATLKETILTPPGLDFDIDFK